MIHTDSAKHTITLGVVIPIFWAGRYFDALMTLRDTAKKFNINLLCFQGTHYEDPYANNNAAVIDSTGEIIFKIIKKESLDGLIVISGALKKHEQKLTLINNCKKLYGLPLIHVGAKIDNVSNILIDNETGMSEIVNHFINVHKFTKMAFISGPNDNIDSQIRLNTFKKILAEHNIAPLFIESNGFWTPAWGAKVTGLIVDTYPDVQAIICASDNLANGAYDELRNRNILIPDKISVAGYNDNVTSESATPPLTTVMLNLSERCKEAVRIIIDAINGIPIPSEIIMPSKPIIRQSCGCPPTGIRAMNAQCDHASDAFCKITPDIASQRDTLTNAIIKILNYEYGSTQFAERFVSILIDQLSDLSKPSLLIQFSDLLYEIAKSDQDITQWQWVLNVVNDNLPHLVSLENYAKAKQLIVKSRILINEVSEQENKVDLMRIEERNATINTLNYRFNKVNTLDKIVALLTEELPRLGVPSCYLSLYDSSNTSLDNSRLIFAFDEQGTIDLPENGINYATSKLLPDTIRQPQSNALFIEPLFYNKHQLGFTVFGIGNIERSFYELFASQLSATLWGAMLLAKEQEAEAALKVQTQELEKSNRELETWKQQLEDAYRRLQSNQEKLLISEKMASLGRLTAGITHEMNTPLATLRASLGELQKLGTEYLESIDDPTVTSSDHLEIVEEMTNSINLADKAAERAATFIRSIKAQTRDVKNEPAIVFNIIEVIDGVVVFLGHSLKHGKCTVNTLFSSNKIEIYGLPSKMTQVFTNLITNAIDALANEETRIITISAEIFNQSTLVIKVADTGCGIEAANLLKIFEPMFTTKSFGHGTGLGLSIVHDIVNGEFGGSIEVQSEIGKGTTFILKFDLEQNLKKQQASLNSK